MTVANDPWETGEDEDEGGAWDTGEGEEEKQDVEAWNKFADCYNDVVCGGWSYYSTVLMSACDTIHKNQILLVDSMLND